MEEFLSAHSDDEIVSVNGVPRALVDWSKTLGTLVIVLRDKRGSLVTVELLVEKKGKA
jgi:hypothetical protein